MRGHQVVGVVGGVGPTRILGPSARCAQGGPSFSEVMTAEFNEPTQPQRRCLEARTLVAVVPVVQVQRICLERLARWPRREQRAARVELVAPGDVWAHLEAGTSLDGVVLQWRFLWS